MRGHFVQDGFLLNHSQGGSSSVAGLQGLDHLLNHPWGGSSGLGAQSHQVLFLNHPQGGSSHKQHGRR